MVLRKIVQINEALCNGCGICIPECAEAALQIVDGKAKIIRETYCDGLGACLGYCPQGAIKIVEKEAESFNQKEVEQHLAKREAQVKKKPEVRQWPIKLSLMPIQAPFYENSDLLIAADCAPVAFVDLHDNLLPGKRIMIGCTKLDDAKAYAEKLGSIFKRNRIASVTVAHMEVPCCSGLKWVVDKALQTSGKNLPVKHYIISIGGELNDL